MPRRVDPGRLGQLAVLGGIPAALVVALFGRPAALVVLLVLSVAGEPLLPRKGLVERLLRVGGLGRTVRMLLRFLAVVVLQLARDRGTGAAAVVVLAAGGFVLVHAATMVALARTAARRQLPVTTRNVDLGALRIPPPSPGWARWSSAVINASTLVVLVPACLSRDVPLLAVLGLVGLAAATGVAVRALVVDRATGRACRPDKVVAHVNDFLHDHRPEVVLYFSDTRASVYQVAMWLAVVEQLDRPAVVVLRSRSALDGLAPTTLPVLCAPAAVDVLALKFHGARAGLFVANNGPNIHLLRLAGVASAFIGHGDSDKSASVNPFARVYDQLWTAGAAGRDRWVAADVGVDPDAVVEVGRPQLDVVARETAASRERPGEPTSVVPTLLYAPTWEGWNATQEYGSVAFQGVALVEAALASPDPLRVVYKPHPLTGRRDPRVRAAHQRIVGLLHRANTARGLSVPPVWEAPDVDPLRAVRDLTEQAVRSGQPAYQVSAVEAERRTREAGRAYLARIDAGAHVVVEGPGPELFTYFEFADFLVTDVSSVLSDFSATGRPFATCNTTDLDEPAFVQRAPAAAGGIVVGRDGAHLDEVVAVAAGSRPDEYRQRRDELRTYLLGDVSVPAQQRFATAVDALVGRAEARRRRRA